MPKPKQLIAILIKHNLVAAIALDTEVPYIGKEPEVRHVIGRHDCRESPASTRNILDTAESATNVFYSSLATSHERGWTVAHLGTRNAG